MNKRTIELYNQALVLTYAKLGKEHAGKAFFEAAVAGTFAELIVRECAVELMMQGRLDSADIIKEHFGVKE